MPDHPSDAPSQSDSQAIRAMTQDKDMTTSDADPISAALRKIHDAVLEEPLPDDFLDLLDQIDRKISAAGKTA